MDCRGQLVLKELTLSSCLSSHKAALCIAGLRHFELVLQSSDSRGHWQAHLLAGQPVAGYVLLAGRRPTGQVVAALLVCEMGWRAATSQQMVRWLMLLLLLEVVRMVVGCCR